MAAKSSYFPKCRMAFLGFSPLFAYDRFLENCKEMLPQIFKVNYSLVQNVVNAIVIYKHICIAVKSFTPPNAEGPPKLGLLH
jgi:hypothetical protein